MTLGETVVVTFGEVVTVTVGEVVTVTVGVVVVLGVVVVQPTSDSASNNTAAKARNLFFIAFSSCCRMNKITYAVHSMCSPLFSYA